MAHAAHVGRALSWSTFTWAGSLQSRDEAPSSRRAAVAACPRPRHGFAAAAYRYRLSIIFAATRLPSLCVCVPLLCPTSNSSAASALYLPSPLTVPKTTRLPRRRTTPLSSFVCRFAFAFIPAPAVALALAPATRYNGKEKGKGQS